MFEKELKMVYSEVDKNSDLLWSARSNQEFIRFGGQRTRRNAKTEDEAPKWDRETNATFGYGEITRVSITIVCNIHINLGRFYHIFKLFAKY